MDARVCSRRRGESLRIDILYFFGCPNYPPTAVLVREVVATLGFAAEIREIEVAGDAMAERLRFYGSPTIQVDGLDIDPSAAGRSGHALGCRMYGSGGIPPREMVEQALRSAENRPAAGRAT